MTGPAVAISEPVGRRGAPLVVLGPSLGTSSIVWETVVPRLVASFRVSTWDLPGHGTSPVARQPFAMRDLAASVAEAVRSLGEPARYAGVSLGGAVGLHLALDHPETVDHLVVVCASVAFGAPQAWCDRAARVRAQGTASMITGSAERWFAPGSLSRIPDLGGRLLHALRDADDESYALCCEALADYDVADRLDRIAVPLLALAGAADPVSPPAHAELIAGGVRRGTACTIAHAGHLAPAEQPAAVADAMLRAFGVPPEPETAPR